MRRWCALPAKCGGGRWKRSLRQIHLASVLRIGDGVPLKNFKESDVIRLAFTKST